MGIGTYIGVIIFASPFIILSFAGYWKLFQKAGRHGWEAIIPFYSSYVILKTNGRPTWWFVWLFVPIVGFVMAAGILVEFIKCFGKFTARERAAAIILGFIYLPKWGFEQKTQYLGSSSTPAFQKEYPRSAKLNPVFEWMQALFFAVTFAVLIRAFFIEAYVIPTPSMEQTLLVGDQIFVSKINYGARIPMTPVSFPYANHTIPNTPFKAYWDGLELPYFRLPGFGGVKRGDVLVFNYPQDTTDNRPVDKKEVYIKRCEGIAGDTLSLRDAQVFINGKGMADPPGEQSEYHIKSKGTAINPNLLKELNITTYEGHLFPAMTKQAAARLRTYSNIASVTPQLGITGASDTLNPVFPYEFPLHMLLTPKNPDYKWNVDNFGPIIIPKKGWTVKLDSLTFPLYERAIEVYEHNKLIISHGDICINGIKTNSYTFKMDYYWVMGDNRHDSEDSVYWGFVPEDHVIGKAVFIWMSWDENAPLLGKIRWNRLFKGIN